MFKIGTYFFCLATNLLWAAVNPEMELIKICITFTLAIAFAAPISSLVTGSSLVGSSAGVLALMAANLPLETPKISRTVFAVKSVIVFVAIGQLLLEGFGFAAERASTESHLTGVIVGILMCLLFDEETISFWAKVLMWILILATLIALIILLSRC